MVIYLLLINVFGFGIMLYDKNMARKNKRRVPEKTLFGIAILGGSIGCLVGMYTARHKTRHKSFTIGIPVILALQTLCIYLLLF